MPRLASGRLFSPSSPFNILNGSLQGGDSGASGQKHFPLRSGPSASLLQERKGLQYSNTHRQFFVPFQVGTSTWLQHFLSLADLPEEEEEMVQHRLHAEVHHLIKNVPILGTGSLYLRDQIPILGTRSL